MKKITTLAVALLALLAFNLQAQNAWINEIHYDNAGTDQDETIEVVIENPGSYTLSDFQVDLYNGNGGGVYNTKTLDVFTVGNSVGNFTFYYYTYPSNGIQNGAPDGMALSHQTTLISGQFLSYEGTFTATDGPANGVTSVDIGVSQSSAPIGESLQLGGTGDEYADFAWQASAAPTTYGALNNNQTISTGVLPEPTNYPTAFTASATGTAIATSWTDATGAQLPGSYVVFISDQDNIIAPVDGTPIADDLDFNDGDGVKNVAYGAEAFSFVGLAPNTMYYTAIYPYTNSGTDIDYKTDGTPPEATATTENVVFLEDFDWGWMAWENISVIGDQVWDIGTYGMNGSDAPQINGYSGGAQDNEDWLISSQFDLDGVTNPTLTFYSGMNFSGPDLQVKYSTNYDGGGDPSTATWTDLTANLSTGSYTWTHSGNISLAGINTVVHLAFVYTSSPSAGAAFWKFDDVLVTGDYTINTDIVINEIMYDSPGDDEDWIELYNDGSADVDVSGWFIQNSPTQNIPVAIPSGTVLSPGQYFTISIYTSGSFPFTPDLDGTLQANWQLENNNDEVILYNPGRIQCDYVPYESTAPWPTGCAGGGPSCSLLEPHLNNSNANNWGDSPDNGGTPGTLNFPIAPTINVTSPIGGEVWEQGSTHDITWSTINYTGNVEIELIDVVAGSQQLLGSNIASALGTWSWTIFSSQAPGDDYKIRISDLSGNPVGESLDVFSIVEPYIAPEIVITEIMYNPPESGSDSLEFIELYNNGTEAVDMTGFEFSEGVNYTFPAVTLNPAEYLLVAVNAAAMQSTFGVTAYEWTSGALSNSGELIELVDAGGMFIDSVRYDDALPWDTMADGFGPSLTLCDPGLDNGLAESWSASTEYAAMNTNGDSIWATPLAGCSVIVPTADFEATDATVLVGATTDFNDLSSGGTIVSWMWTFEGGDPATSTEQNPTGILYAAEGTYDVTLEVENDQGESSSTSKTDYISVGYAPVADFEASAVAPFIGQDVFFTDLSTGTVTEWLWEFEGGDPANSILQDPGAVVFNTVGEYDVSLTVVNDYGESTMLKEDYIYAQPIGINEIDEEGLVRIYPNPSNGILHIENSSEETLYLSIYSLTGEKIYEKSINKGLEILNLENAEPGIYFVRYYNESQQLNTSKLIIK